MPTVYSRVVLVFPVSVPGGVGLRSVIDTQADEVTIVREDDGALTLTRGSETVRIERPVIERADLEGGGTFETVRLPPGAVRPAVDGGLMTLFRPVGDPEWALIVSTGRTRFPPRLPEQPIFYPVCNEAYAWEIAEGWNVPEGYAARVVRFKLREEVARRWPVRCAGALRHTELWVPSEELELFNDALVGSIEDLPRASR